MSMASRVRPLLDRARREVAPQVGRTLRGAGNVPAGWRDARRLRRDAPRFAPSSLAEHRAGLEPVYAEYVSAVSTPIEAASLEVCAYLAFLCDELRPQRVMDAGSGFSSYVLRRYQLAHPETTVVSVDDAAPWLDRTAAFLEQHGVGTEALIPWDEFTRGREDDFDIVFHDLAHGSAREAGMPLVTARVAAGGCVVFDDANLASHRAAMRRAAGGAGMAQYSLRQWTHDRYGRFSMLAVRRSATAP
jgi:predicted O-methyltransferase YrrM